MSRILIVDDDEASCRTLQFHLRSQNHSVEITGSVDEGLAVADSYHPDLIILDIRMPGRSGLEGLPDFIKLLPSVHVIMITAFHDMESTIEAMQQGAEDYIHKPIDIDELDTSIARLLTKKGDTDNLLIPTSPENIGDALSMVGRSRAMKEIFKTIGLVAKSPASVLITGESGTGKELVARAIHRSSQNPNGPFVAVNCAALVETLLESDMFGHEKGAFTGAVVRQEGKFSLARGGTIFLDEVGELSPGMQAKLLRVLQYKEFTPLGAKESQTTNARVITATNVDLAEKVSEKSFREDLYYRLQVVNIHLPPLRERKEDLMDLIQTLLGRINKELHRNVTHINKEVL
ncbi:MAG: sigma-54 dependent transcriptional regulator, partial [Candidatus Thiodiazotropha endolucinida]